MKELVLLTSAMPRRLREKLETRYELCGPFPGWPENLPEGEICGRVRALVTYGAIRTNAAAMDRLPNLRLIACYASGYEGIDLEAAAARGIAICNSPGANASAVADLTLGLMIAIVRDLVEGDRYARDGRWVKAPRSAGPGLTGRKVGIYGYGEIGRRVAVRCEAFEMEVGYHSRAPREGVGHAYHGDLLSLAEWSDILVVSTRAGEANRGAVSAEVLAALGPRGYLVNVSRGSMIDEDALARALEDGAIAGAALDVFEGEPAINEALAKAPRTIFSPHIGGNSFEAHDAAQDMVLQNLEAFFDGRPVPHPVSP